ncbi:MAG: hypothetical protein MPN21_06425 [Thermoanaerobaculia bacterium]|nr:hypothetical protein [Thermoanaerobaculia bacterium]
MDNWLVILISTNMAFFLGLIWIVVHYRSRRQEQKAEERSKLLDRFESPETLLQFLDSESGRRYLLLAGAAPTSRTALVWVCFFGLVALVGGASVLFLAQAGLLDGGDGFYILGGLLLAGGIGILIGTAVAFQLLQKN